MAADKLNMHNFFDVAKGNRYNLQSLFEGY